MKILFVAATSFEIAPLEQYLRENFSQSGEHHFVKEEMEIFLLISGVGLSITAYSLGRVFANNRFDLAVHAGVCGALDRKLDIGQVVQVVSEEFGDLGVEDANGNFINIFRLELIDQNQPPFKNGRLVNEGAGKFEFLPKVFGTSVNKVHGFQPSIDHFKEKSGAEVETMEGAAFFYACLMENIPFVEIRAVSNYVEPRNRTNWELPQAINNLNKTLVEMVEMLMEQA